MAWLEALFWASAACIIYPYVVYPLVVGILAKWKRRRLAASPELVEGTPLPSVSVVLAVYNEGAIIDRRLRDLLGQIRASGIAGEVIVVSDGSTDRTADQARDWAHRDSRVRVIALDANRGKAAALSAGCTLARKDIIVFADARQSWAPDALACLLANFTGPEVGAVGGELVIESAPGIMAGVGLYWRFEKWLRRQESAVSSTVGVTGAISAVRRPLFRPIPPGTILDDVYWPLGVAMQGYRVVHEPRAQAFDHLPERIQDEFRRKVRTLSGNFQLLGRLPGALAPTRNPIWIQFFSHKLMRLVVPWALLVMLGASAALPGPIYRAAFWWQVEFYLVAAAGLSPWVGIWFRPAAATASFVVLNAAGWLAFWTWATGRTTRLWHKTSYRWSTLEGMGR
jgi:cellulose synthase/poly-beta-1,6-N-acetylglucosamine synthase-like glycosyltransferase